jgi:type VI secretion system secreted protein VgrG
MPVTLPDRSDALLSMTLDGKPQVLAPIRLTVREAISAPFEIDLTAVHAVDPFDPADILQKPVEVMIRRDEVERVFSGIVQEYTPVAQDLRGFHACRLRIVPKLWALSQWTDCRIFQEKTPQDIIGTLLDEAGVQKAFRITGANPTLPYRTQFNEDSLRFLTRIMEEAGWYYFLEGEKVVVTDANASLGSIGAMPAPGALIEEIRAVHATARGKEATADYDHTAPSKEVKGEQATKLKATGPLSPDSFRWPALTDDPAEAAARSKLRMEAQEARSSLLAGNGAWAALAAGTIFEIAADDAFLPPGKYAVRSVVHQASDENWLSGGTPPSYSNSFEVLPEATPWRQPLETRRPRMDGVHAAIVIGTDSEGDIHTDDMGRVKIRFFWDHRAEAAPDNGVWARVVQPWAGAGWGGQFIPRVGSEVAVAFMDGDPDRPVVLGGLYNGADVAIFPKAEKTKSGFRTRSTDKGGNDEFSEFSFDDKGGEELVFLHAQKNLKVTVENDQLLKVDNCRIIDVKVDETKTVKGEQKLTVKGNQTVVVEQGKHSFTVKTGDRVEAVDTGNYKLGVKTGNFDTSVDTGNYKLGVKLGNVDVKADAGTVTIEAMQTLTLKVGANSIEISQSGIKISGTMIDMKGSAMTTVASPMTTVKGDGMLTLKGGVVMIN